MPVEVGRMTETHLPVLVEKWLGGVTYYEMVTQFNQQLSETIRIFITFRRVRYR